MLSPNAISEAAVAEAMKGCKRHIDFDSNPSTTTICNNDTTTNSNDFESINDRNTLPSNKKQRLNDSNEVDESEDSCINENDRDGNNETTNITRSTTKKSSSTTIQKAMDRINQIWNNTSNQENADENDTSSTTNCDASNENNHPNTTKINQTKQIIYKEFQNIIRLGMEAFHKNDTLNRELIQAKELSESRKREIERLKLSEDDSRASLSNLLQAVEASKSNARDTSRAAQTEARLRSEVTSIKYERDVALGTNAELKRRSNLLEEEVRMLKARVGRLTQDKIKIERESRAALGLARSMDNHVASDVEFYRRKVADLNDHLQSKNKIITELKEEVESYKRDMERSLSQNRLSQIRRSGSRKR